MKAITLWQPWATLCFERPPCTAAEHGVNSCRSEQPYKWIETRSWPCPPSLIGQRIAIHAAARGSRQLPREARPMMVGPSFNGGERFLWPGGMFGDASIPLPRGVIVGTARVVTCLPMVDHRIDSAHILVEDDGLWMADDMIGQDHGQGMIEPVQDGWSIADQRPFGDFAPGRFGWVLDGAVKFEQPIPAKGRQRLWNLPDDLAYLEARGAV